MMKPAPSLTLDEYVVISKDLLLRDDQFFDFDIYCSRTAFPNEEPILLANKDSEVASLKKAIANIEFDQLYINKHDVEKFHLFLEDSLQNVLACRDTPLEKKALILYTCAKNAITEVFNKPKSSKNVARMQNIAKGQHGVSSMGSSSMGPG